MKQIRLLMALCLAVGCSYQNDADEQRLLQGAWLLRQVEYPYDVPDDTLSEQEGTALLLYDGDSVVYQCWMTKTESGLVVRPGSQRAVTLIDKGGGEQVYIEGDNPRPLTIVDDSTIVIQRDGTRYTYRRADDMAVEWGTDIRNIVAANAGKNNSEEKPIYVLSAKERQQASYIQWLLATIVMIVVLAVANNVVARRRRRQLQLQLQQIQEVRQERSQTVRQAWTAAEGQRLAGDRGPGQEGVSGLCESAAGAARHVGTGIPGVPAHQAPHRPEGHRRRAGSRHEHHQHRAQPTLQEGVRTEGRRPRMGRIHPFHRCINQMQSECKADANPKPWSKRGKCLPLQRQFVKMSNQSKKT